MDVPAVSPAAAVPAAAFARAASASAVISPLNSDTAAMSLPAEEEAVPFGLTTAAVFTLMAPVWTIEPSAGSAKPATVPCVPGGAPTRGVDTGCCPGTSTWTPRPRAEASGFCAGGAAPPTPLRRPSTTTPSKT